MRKVMMRVCVCTYTYLYSVCIYLYNMNIQYMSCSPQRSQHIARCQQLSCSGKGTGSTSFTRCFKRKMVSEGLTTIERRVSPRQAKQLRSTSFFWPASCQVT